MIVHSNRFGHSLHRLQSYLILLERKIVFFSIEQSKIRVASKSFEQTDTRNCKMGVESKLGEKIVV